MANILDYLSWRGDLSLQQSPFNEVDNLILAELSFVKFTGIVPPPGEGKGVPLEQAAEIAVSAILGFLREHDLPRTVKMVCFDGRTKAAYEAAYQKHGE